MAIFKHLSVLEIFHSTQGPSAKSFYSNRDKKNTHANNVNTGKSGDIASQEIRVLWDRLPGRSELRERWLTGLQEEPQC